MNDFAPRARMRLFASVFILSALFSNAAVADGERDPRSDLPLGYETFNALLDALGQKVNGEPAAMAGELRALGFSCDVNSGTFLCVRFSCRRGVALRQGARLQWTVSQDRRRAGGYAGLPLDFTATRGCVPETEREAAQKQFLSGHSVPWRAYP
ncbi:MAG TPA: hypothetical protein VGO04_10280 [Ensifer sp.]|jgi:hypothetical protein|uniref:hypothetical protein n=1 Tax=Ensifer sp. TaxID=1872086 RepID=UPI002E0D92EF|nr:hypothetical protein [Ensifer sp.]